jgi:hypothetical protein
MARRNLLETLDEWPPFLVRALAIKGRGASTRRKTIPELVRETGVSARTLEYIFARTTWAGVKIGVADRIFKACKVNPLRRTVQYDRVRRRLAPGNLGHLLPRQRKRLDELVAKYLENEQQNGRPKPAAAVRQA